MLTAGKHEGQAGGGHQHLHGDLGILERVASPVSTSVAATIRRGADGCPSASGSSRSASRCAQRVVAEGVELGGGEQPHGHFPAAPDQRIGQIPAPQPALQGAASASGLRLWAWATRRHSRRISCRAPALPPRTRPWTSRRTEHGAGRHAADGADPQPILEQSVQHPPGEGAMGAAALQRESDARAAGTVRRTRFRHAGQSGGWKRRGQRSGCRYRAAWQDCNNLSHGT